MTGEPTVPWYEAKLEGSHCHVRLMAPGDSTDDGQRNLFGPAHNARGNMIGYAQRPSTQHLLAQAGIADPAASIEAAALRQLDDADAQRLAWISGATGVAAVQVDISRL